MIITTTTTIIVMATMRRIMGTSRCSFQYTVTRPVAIRFERTSDGGVRSSQIRAKPIFGAPAQKCARSDYNRLRVHRRERMINANSPGRGHRSVIVMTGHGRISKYRIVPPGRQLYLGTIRPPDKRRRSNHNVVIIFIRDRQFFFFFLSNSDL